MLPRRFKTRTVLEAVAWIILFAFLGHRMWPQAAAALGIGSSRTGAPAFSLTTLAGESVSLESLRGRVVLVNFWATWCPPCRVEMPGFQKVHDRHAAEGFTVLGISTDARGGEHVAAFLAERGITYPVAMASGNVVRDFGGVNTLPTSFLIDRQGRIRYEVRGLYASPVLEQAVKRLLAEPMPGAPGAPAPAGSTGGAP